MFIEEQPSGDVASEPVPAEEGSKRGLRSIIRVQRRSVLRRVA